MKNDPEEIVEILDEIEYTELEDIDDLFVDTFGGSE